MKVGLKKIGMERVLKFPVMVYADDVKGGMTRSICEFNVRAVQQLFLKNFQTIWE